MTEELTLRVTDLERKAIAFCREKDVPFPIANYLVDFATEATKELQEKFDKRLKRHCNTIHSLVDELERRQNAEKELQEENKKIYQRMTGLDKVLDRKNEQIEKMKCGQNCKHSYLYQEDRKCKFTYCDCTNCKDKWEIME